jgi:hypothetical protein
MKELTRENILLFLQKGFWTAATLRSKFVYIKAAFEYAHKKGIIEENPLCENLPFVVRRKMLYSPYLEYKPIVSQKREPSYFVTDQTYNPPKKRRSIQSDNNM